MDYLPGLPLLGRRRTLFVASRDFLMQAKSLNTSRPKSTSLGLMPSWLFRRLSVTPSSPGRGT